MIPEYKNLNSSITIFINNGINKSGNYTINSNGRVIRGIAFNYDRTESELNTPERSALEKMLNNSGMPDVKIISTSGKSLSTVISELNKGFRLWKTFIILALIFLLGEVILLRFWRS
jgi:hypothetical protein